MTVSSDEAASFTKRMHLLPHVEGRSVSTKNGDNDDMKYQNETMA
jgi:hypothetical protein